MTASSRLASAFVATSLILGGPASVAAERASPDESSAEDRQRAAELFNEGRTAYRKGDNETAIDKWKASFGLSGEPLIHLNIGNAYERLSNLERAVYHLELWFPHAPAEERIDLRKRIEILKRRREKPPPAPDRQPVRVEKVVVLQPAGSNSLEIAGWVTLGVGAAAGIAGGIVSVLASQRRPDANESCVNTGGRLLCRDQDRDDITATNTQALAGDVTWVAGATLATAGAVLLVLAFTGDDVSAEGGDIGWTLSPGGFGLAF